MSDKEKQHSEILDMLITFDWDAHMSTGNTVACMGQGQAAGATTALCADAGFYLEGTSKNPHFKAATEI